MTKKEEIAAKLQQSISSERIIDDIRDSCFDKGIRRHYLLEKKDQLQSFHSFPLHLVSCLQAQSILRL